MREVFVPAYPPRRRAWRSLKNRPGVRAFEEGLAAVRPELVHFHNLHIHFSYGALDAARETGASVVLTVHDVMPFCYQKMFCFLDEGAGLESAIDYRAGFFRCLGCTRLGFNPFRNRFIRNAIRRSVDRVMAVSRPMLEALQVNGIPVHGVIHNGIDCTKWRPAADQGAWSRKRFGLEGKKVIFHGGRLDRLKGSLHLVRAVAAFKNRIPGVKLLLPGKMDSFAEEMTALAESLGVRDALIFPGWLEGKALQEAYDAADVVASPSLCFDSFNLINLEGMALGKPVVASFFGGPAEIIEDGVSGFLVNPLNERVLSEKLAALLSDKDLARRMGLAGRRRVEEHFDIKKAAEKTHELYMKILKKTGQIRLNDPRA